MTEPKKRRSTARTTKAEVETEVAVASVTSEEEAPAPAANVINAGPDGILETGSTAEVVTDLFPAKVTPRPDLIPKGISKIRVTIVDKAMTLAWSGGFKGGEPIVNRLDIPLADGAENASYKGGVVLGVDGISYTVEKGNGCSCGAGGLKTWKPYATVKLTQRSYT